MSLAVTLLLVLVPGLVLECVASSFVSDWSFLGPFPVGKTEFDGDPVAAYGGIHNISPLNASFSIPSELMTGGLAAWRQVTPKVSRDSLGLEIQSLVVPEQDSGVDIQQVYNTMSNQIEAVEIQGWIVGTLRHVPPQGLLVSCLGCHTFRVEDRHFMGDPYSKGIIGTPIMVGGSASATIRMRVRGRVHAQVSLRIEPLPSPQALSSFLEVRALGLMPDVVDGYLPGAGKSFGGAPFGVVVVNRHPTHPMTHFSVVDSMSDNAGDWTIEPWVGKNGIGIFGSSDSLPLTVAPGQSLPLVFKASLRRRLHIGEVEKCGSIPLMVKAKLQESGRDEDEWPTIGVPTEVPVRCRHGSQSFLIGFLDQDDTHSVAAVLAPRSPQKCSSDNGCPVIISFSGVGATPLSHADAHKFKPKSHTKERDFVFGAQRAWVLVPYRDGPHNGEGSGLLSTWAALESLQDFAVEHNSFRGTAALDPRKIVYMGHSRGGHWTLTTSIRHPDPALAVLPLSAWMCREMYSDANTMHRFDVGLSHVDQGSLGGPRAVLEGAIEEHDASWALGNLKHKHLLVRTGTADTTVPPWYSRRLARELSISGADVQLSLVEGQPHWWWDSQAPNDGGALWDAEVRSFVTASLTKRQSTGQLPDDDTFTVASGNPATFFGSRGFRILQHDSSGQRAFLHVATIGADENQSCLVRAVNARRFMLYGRSLPHDRSLPLATTSSSFGWPTPLPPPCAGGLVVNGHVVSPHDLVSLRTFVSLPNTQSRATQQNPRSGAVDDRSLRRHFGSLPSLVQTFNQNGTGEWFVHEIGHDLRSSKKRWDLVERSPSTSGPMRQVFSRPALLVVPSASLPSIELDTAIFIASNHLASVGTGLMIVDEATLFPPCHQDAGQNSKFCSSPASRSALRDKNLIIIGGVPFQNRLEKLLQSSHLDESHLTESACKNDNADVSQEICSAGDKDLFLPSRPPVTLIESENGGAGTIRLGCCEWGGAGVGAAFVRPRWSAQPTTPGATPYLEAQLDLIVTGSDREGIKAVTTSSYSFASNQPLGSTRAIFTNTWPDVLVVGPRFEADGIGGILAAGSFDSADWEWTEAPCAC